VGAGVNEFKSIKLLCTGHGGCHVKRAGLSDILTRNF